MGEDPVAARLNRRCPPITYLGFDGHHILEDLAPTRSKLEYTVFFFNDSSLAQLLQDSVKMRLGVPEPFVQPLLTPTVVGTEMRNDANGLWVNPAEFQYATMAMHKREIGHTCPNRERATRPQEFFGI